MQSIFALIPPPSIWGGWLCFIVSLIFIGLLTAVVADLANIFGCLIGLESEVTAITFVALGTSLPDLFASKTAATMEKHADSAIGNVTGSNSVNVFLGLGMAWVVASGYWTSKVNQYLLILLLKEIWVASHFYQTCAFFFWYTVYWYAQMK